MTQLYMRLIGRNRAREVMRPYLLPNDPPKVRAAKSRASRAAQRALNLDNSAVKLEFMLDMNFGPDDLFCTLTFKDGCLPKTRKEVIKCARRFFDMLRKARKLKGDVLKYIYCVEHGEGRWHIHAVINAVGLDYEQIRSLWSKWGDNVDFKAVGEKSIEGIAHYMVKETDRPNSARSWIPSKNLIHPTYESYIVKKPARLHTPAGCSEVTARIDKDEGIGFEFIKYDVPPSISISNVSGLGDISDPDIVLLSRRPF